MKELGGPELSGLGFGMGITRLILAMKESGAVPQERKKPLLYIASLGGGAVAKSLEIVSALRQKGVFAQSDLCARSLKAQMKYADKIGAKYTLILGDNEIESGKAMLRLMSDSTQTEINIDEIYEALEQSR